MPGLTIPTRTSSRGKARETEEWGEDGGGVEEQGGRRGEGGNNEGMQQAASKHTLPHSPQPQPPQPPPLKLNIHPSRHQNSCPTAGNLLNSHRQHPPTQFRAYRAGQHASAAYIYTLYWRNIGRTNRDGQLYILVKCYIGFCTQGTL
jgi:hypothetical protein